MVSFIYKYRFQIGFVFLFTAGIGLCIGGIVVPVLIPVGAALIAGALGMLSQSLNNQSSETRQDNEHQLPNETVTEERRLSIDSHDVHNTYTINNNGPMLYMYSPDTGQVHKIENKSHQRLELV